MKTQILKRSSKRVFLASASISCGEPAEICTALELIDLNEFVTNGQDGVYLIQANGDSMAHEIRIGDWLVVNRNLCAKFGDAVVVCLNGNHTVKDYQPKRGGLMLVPKNKLYQSQTVTRQDDFEVFGVVTGIFRNFKKN